jgi:predicted O-methyltransferase YrrM
MANLVAVLRGIPVKAVLTLALPLLFLAGLLRFPASGAAESRDTSAALDAKVRSFLDSRAGSWHDMNVPESDGKLLHDLVLKNGYKRALEIGTSTGHSAIWIAWGLSKTGGKLVTIEIDPSRHRAALRNFEEAGLSGYIEARLGDAHDLVAELPGPFDFVFNDADKDWYKNYFVAVSPKLEVGGTFAAHNASGRDPGIREFLEHVKARKNYTTTIDRSSRSGVSISRKEAAD